MARYHINPAGDVGVCKAAVSCPFGDMEADHYGSKDEARQAYERKMAEEANAPKKAYRSYSKAESMEVARTIKSQIGSGPLMALGAHSFTAIEGGLRFNARILPFNKTGERSTRPSNMIVEVRHNALDYYDVKVQQIKGFTASTHYEAEDIPADRIGDVIRSLDWDGEEVTNPRV